MITFMIVAIMILMVVCIALLLIGLISLTMKLEALKDRVADIEGPPPEEDKDYGW